MDVVNMTLKIRIVTNLMFPITPSRFILLLVLIRSVLGNVRENPALIND